MKAAAAMLVLVLTACAGTPSSDGPAPAPTIASLRTEAQPVTEDLPVDATLDKAIDSYRRLLPEAGETELAPEILRRLADLTLELGEVSDAEQGGGLDNVAVARAYTEAEALYQRVLNEYPDAEQIEQVYYQLARVHEARAQPETLLATLTVYAQRFADSPRIDEVQFRRGELLFSAKEFTASVTAYEAVISYGEQSPFYEQSLYKHGWALFKQFQYDEGLDSFLTLLDRRFAGSQDPRPLLDTLPRGERERIEDALRAVSLTFSYQDGAISISEYFDKRASRPWLDLLYERLADHYLAGERFNDAAQTLEAYSQSHGDASRAPDFMVRVIDVYENAGFAKRVLGARTAFAERYQLTGDYWRSHEPAQREEVLVALRDNLDKLARHHHATAQQQQSSTDYEQAEKWYRIYLRDFPRDPQTPGMNFLLAESLYENRRFDSATTEYEQTAYAYALHEKSAEAGYAALLAYAEQAKTLPGEEADEVNRQSVESSVRFAHAFPQHEQAATVLTRASEALYQGGDLARAEDAAVRVLEWEGPTSDELRRSAWIVAADVRFDLQRFGEAETGYQQARAITDQKLPLYGQLSERLAASVYKQAESDRDRGDLAAAARNFLRVGEVVPDAGIRSTAQYDAAAAYIALEDWGASIDVLRDFRSRYPGHELQGEVTRKLAVAYLESEQPLFAAGELERMEANSADPGERRAVMLQAADLYEKSGATADTVRVLERFVSAFPRPAGESIEQQQRLVALHEKLNDRKARRRWLQEIVKTDAGAGGERSDRTRYLAAHASLQLADPFRLAFESNRLTVPLNKSLPRKKTNMENALMAYGHAADYGVADVTTQATFRIADIYHSFSKALFDSERPANLNAEELEQYEILLEEQAFPFEEQAIEVHEVNVLRITEGLYDDWVKRSFESLSTLLPVRYAKREIAETHVESLY